MLFNTADDLFLNWAFPAFFVPLANLFVRPFSLVLGRVITVITVITALFSQVGPRLNSDRQAASDGSDNSKCWLLCADSKSRWCGGA